MTTSLRLKKTRQHRRWEERLVDLIVAGGALGFSACSSQVEEASARQRLPEAGPYVRIPCGNANPDPCICGRPDGDPTVAAECAAKLACEADGGTYTYYTGHPCEFPDARAHTDAAAKRTSNGDASHD